MTKNNAIKILQKKLNFNIICWKFAGADFQNEIMVAETALAALNGGDSYMTESEAMSVAERFK